MSINCTTYNHENYIADAIESFLSQKTNFNYEILIGEDCSTDNTKQIVEKYAKMYSEKIKLITSSHNVGARKNSLRLIENSKGKYIAECEGDDYWTDPYKLQRQVDYMENHPDCSLCFHSAEIIQAPDKSTGRMIRSYFEDTISPIGDIISGGGGFCPTPSLLYPKRYMETPPSYYLKAPIGDYPMQMYLASQGYAYYMDRCMSAYRTGVKGSWTNRMSFGSNIKGKIIQINEGIIQLLDGFSESTKHEYQNEVNKAKQKIEFELLILKKQKKEQKYFNFGKYSWLLKIKARIKIFIRCNYPKLFLKLSKLKTAKISRKTNE
ncbi:glycosyltransferase family 2 protein [Psychrobacillus sp. NEAU-3TGS]|uniref:glycosyltransferase family 2 protein n=1 Tax=Psychrobacillus sp. NEAU-3TGS TaxID=2995412 RepID=UPI0024973046|nr:glycosyltransferase family 2 protein [Psychrobacillus sp. NEAU-3TGS]MDI2586532.1 glycosyltransferase family 2 protein [Psychrobacillus sp. NEAU-3TGS]